VLAAQSARWAQARYDISCASSSFLSQSGNHEQTNLGIANVKIRAETLKQRTILFKLMTHAHSVLHRPINEAGAPGVIERSAYATAIGNRQKPALFASARKAGIPIFIQLVNSLS
jgi:hypothetical protein